MTKVNDYKKSIMTSIMAITILTSVIAMGNIPNAHAGGGLFFGFYAEENWNVETNGGDGFVIFFGADFVNVLGDNSEAGARDTAVTIEIPCDGSVNFDWFYQTQDTGPAFDPAGYLLNGVFNQITDNAGSDFQSGLEDVAVQQGDIFGFIVHSNDGVKGPAQLTVTPYGFPPTECDEVDPVEGLEQLIADVDSLDANNGIKNSLTKKLDNAINNLTNDDPTDDEEACEKLQSFVDQLEAMIKTGSQLTEQDIVNAEQMIADATEILNVLCPLPG